MRKPTKQEHINLFFSAFLIIAFIVCSNFFSSFTSTQDMFTMQIISSAVYAVFGLLLFYATRVGDGKAIARFSPITLIVLVLPSLYIIIATLGASMPLHDVFVDKSAGHLSIISSLAAVALAFGGFAWLCARSFAEGADNLARTAGEEASRSFEEVFLFIPPKRMAEIGSVPSRRAFFAFLKLQQK